MGIGARDTPRQMDEKKHEELSYPLEAWECTTAATPRKYMVFGTESRDAQAIKYVDDVYNNCIYQGSMYDGCVILTYTWCSFILKIYLTYCR